MSTILEALNELKAMDEKLSEELKNLETSEVEETEDIDNSEEVVSDSDDKVKDVDSNKILADLVIDEKEAIEGYDKAIDDLDAMDETSDKTIDVLKHIEEEELEHIEELSKVVAGTEDEIITENLDEADSNLKTWICVFDGNEIGTVEASNEDDAYNQMELKFPKLEYGLYDGVAEVYLKEPQEKEDIEEKLIQSSSEKAFEQNIKTEIEAGKSQNQAVAIAYDIKRKNENAELPKYVVRYPFDVPPTYCDTEEGAKESAEAIANEHNWTDEEKALIKIEPFKETRLNEDAHYYQSYKGFNIYREKDKEGNTSFFAQRGYNDDCFGSFDTFQELKNYIDNRNEDEDIFESLEDNFDGDTIFDNFYSDVIKPAEESEKISVIESNYSCTLEGYEDEPNEKGYIALTAQFVTDLDNTEENKTRVTEFAKKIDNKIKSEGWEWPYEVGTYIYEDKFDYPNKLAVEVRIRKDYTE